MRLGTGSIGGISCELASVRVAGNTNDRLVLLISFFATKHDIKAWLWIQ